MPDPGNDHANTNSERLDDGPGFHLADLRAVRERVARALGVPLGSVQLHGGLLGKGEPFNVSLTIEVRA